KLFVGERDVVLEVNLGRNLLVRFAVAELQACEALAERTLGIEAGIVGFLLRRAVLLLLEARQRVGNEEDSFLVERLLAYPDFALGDKVGELIATGEIAEFLVRLSDVADGRSVDRVDVPAVVAGDEPLVQSRMKASLRLACGAAHAASPAYVPVSLSEQFP